MKFKNLLYILFLVALGSIGPLNTLAGEDADDAKGPLIKSLVLNDATMQEVARLLSNATGIPIIVSNKASDVKVDIFLQKAYCIDILNAVCRSYGMYCRKDKNSGIIHVQTIDELRDNIQLYNDESVEVITLLYPRAQDVGDTLQQLFVDRVVWVKPDDNSGDAYDNIKDALKRMELIAKKGTFDFSSSSGESAESSDDDDDDDDDDNDKKNVAGQSLSSARNKNKKSHLQKTKDILSLTSEQKVLEAMKKALAEKKMATAMDLTGEPGIVYIAAMPENNTLLLRSSDREALRQMKQLVAKLDKPSPQVLLEVKILAVDVTDTNARAIDFLFSGGSLSGGFADGLPTVSGGGQAIQSSSSLLIPQGSGIDTQAAIFNAITENFRARVQMLEKEGRITRLATPNLLVSDNEASKLFVGQEVTVMQKAERTLTYTNSSSGAQNPNLSWNIDAPRRKIGISLVITPKIHADRTVTVRLLQERSALGDMRENVYSGGESQEEGDLLNTDTASTSDSSTSESRFFLSQDIDMQSVTTTVVGKDAKIMVIGGFIEETAEKEVQKLPWLSELPVLGKLLFTRFEEIRKRSEIIVVIRPFVLLAPGEGAQVSKTFMKRISLHPSARDDIPALGLMKKKDIAKGSRINPDDPWYKRLLQRLDVWKIDMDTAPELEDELREYHIRKDDQETLEAIQKLKQYEQNSRDKSQVKNKEQDIK